MQLWESIGTVFSQLSESLEALNDEEYTMPSKTLFNATIGQHIRHIIELFQCLEMGYQTGTVNYEERKRDLSIETKREFAKDLLSEILKHLEKPNRPLLLEGSFDEESSVIISLSTNYYRELVYNLEHTVHHMALIRIGINEVSQVEVPVGFGVASSTIKYRKSCAQ